MDLHADTLEFSQYPAPFGVDVLLASVAIASGTCDGLSIWPCCWALGNLRPALEFQHGKCAALILDSQRASRPSQYVSPHVPLEQCEPGTWQAPAAVAINIFLLLLFDFPLLTQIYAPRQEGMGRARSGPRLPSGDPVHYRWMGVGTHLRVRVTLAHPKHMAVRSCLLSA